MALQTENLVLELLVKAQTDAIKSVAGEINNLKSQVQTFGGVAATQMGSAQQAAEKAFTALSNQGARKNLLLTQISMRDMGSSMVIQAQQIRTSIDQILQGFMQFEIVTQQITVLDEHMKGLRKEVAAAAFDIAIRFGLAVQDVAVALKEVVALGIDFKDALTIINVAAQGAAAGMGTLSNASQLMITTSRQFGLSIKDSSETMAKLVFIANETAFNIDDMSVALAIAGPAAASLGFSVEETAVALSTLRDAGLDASTAGTALRQFMIRLQDPTGQAAEALQELGIELTDDQGNFKDLATILDETLKAMQDLEPAQRAQIQATIFEVRGQQLVNVARSRGVQHMKDLIEQAQKFNDSEKASAFLTEKSAEALDTQSKAFLSAQARAFELNTVYSQSLLPAETSLLNITTGLKSIFASLPEPMRNVIGTMLLFGTAAGQAFGQTSLLIVNIFTIIKNVGPLFYGVILRMKAAIVELTLAYRESDTAGGGFSNMLSIIRTKLTATRLAALGAGIAIGGIVTAMIAMQEHDPTMRNILIGLTALQFGLAGAAVGAAIAQNAAASAYLGPALAAYLPIITGILLASIATGVLLASKPPAGAAMGAVVPPSPGQGRIFRVGEATQSEIISPVNMMRDTVRSVLKETGTGGQVVINPTISVAPFTSLSDNAVKIVSEELSKDILKSLKRKGLIIR